MEKSWSYEELIEAVKTSISISEILKKLGLKPKGSNYKTMHRYFELYNIDTSHLLGLASAKGKIRNDNRKSSADMFVKNNSIHAKISTIKSRLINDKIFPYECSECGIYEWKNKPLSLHLDHINGDSFDNRTENLRFLCPNCHSQTDTYCGKKNKKSKKEKYCTCGVQINVRSNSCKKCAQLLHPQKSKTDWTKMETIVQLVKDTSFEHAARTLGVSSQSIRTHMKSAGIDPKSISGSSRT